MLSVEQAAVAATHRSGARDTIFIQRGVEMAGTMTEAERRSSSCYGDEEKGGFSVQQEEEKRGNGKA